MNFALRLLLIATLALGSWSCNKGNAPNESVSANADQTQRSEQPEPNQAPKTKQRNVNREPGTQPPAAESRRAPAAEPAPAPQPAPAPRARTTETVPDGTALTVTLADAISTGTNKEGDHFTAHLSDPLIVNGKIVAEKGDRISGHIKTLEEPGRVKGRARLELVLDEITTSNHTYKISTEPFIAVGGSNKDRDAGMIAGGAGVGAIIGAVTGGGKGAAIGAIIGGGTGTTAVLLTKGDQLKLEPETKVNFVLSKDIDLPVIRNANT